MAPCTPMPTLLSPMTPRVPSRFTCPPHRPPPNDSDTQPVCSPRPPQILASIPCVPSLLLPGFKEGAGQPVPQALHPGPRREFSTNGESHQTGALFFLPVASFILGNCTHHQRGHTQDPGAHSQLPPPNTGRASNTPERHSAFISILSGNQAQNKCAVCVI